MTRKRVAVHVVTLLGFLIPILLTPVLPIGLVQAAPTAMQPLLDAAEDFTIIALPDTQNYSTSYPAVYSAQTDWVVDNKDALGIAYVAHEGDIVNNAATTAEWDNASAAMGLLEDPATTGLPDGIPYSMVPGNHDLDNGSTPPATNYNIYFGTTRFEGRGYYGGHYDTDNDDNYTLFSAGGMDFIAISLAYDTTPDTAILDWAEDLLQTHGDRRGIVVSHYLLKLDGTFGPQGQAIYDALKDNPNLFLMLCGHIHAEARRTDTYNGNTIYTLLADYQDDPNGGNGWLRILEFSPASNEIRVKTYSPTLDSYETDANSQFTLSYDMGAPPPEDWTAYVDLSAQAGDNNHANVLQLVPTCVYPCTPPPPLFDPATDWVLKDIDTGANLPATMSVDMQVQYATGNGGDSDSGTDADQIFGGIVDGVGGYEIAGSSGDYVTLTFDNLDPGKEYVVAVTYNRNKTPPYTDRASEFTISGADTRVNASSSGVVVNSEDSVSFVTGDNFGNGYVAKWTGVTAADGSFSITAVQDQDTGQVWTGSKGYAMTSIMLQQVGAPPPPPENWTAYNDLAWGSGQLEGNVTKITSPSGGSGLPSSGSLVDYSTGAVTDVELTVTGGEFVVANATQGAEPTSGTDASTFFNGKLSSLGAISYVNAAGANLVLTLTGMDSSKSYNLVFHAHRDSYGWDRASLVTISGADAFTNESSSGTDNNSNPLFDGPSDASTRLPSDNDNGYVARFTNVDPGSDGEVVFTISWDGTSGNEYKGKYASALMVQETEAGPPPPPENWTAYNDLAWGSGQLEGNVTKITSPSGGSGLPSSGSLVDYSTGAVTDVELTVTGGEFVVANATQGAEPTSGTDASTFFNGKLSSLGAISYVNAAGANLVLTLTGMDSSKSYNLVFHAHRDSYGWDRASLVTISGADAFTNESSSGTDNNSNPLFDGPSDASTRLPSDNDNGYVARFTNVDPGSDGEVVFTISWDGTSGNEYKGKYASALMVQETEAGPPPPPENWTAYNDLAWGSGQLEGNITKITSPNGDSGLPSSGELVDFDSGSGVGVTLAVTGGSFNGGTQANFGGEPAASTDAYTFFDGKLSALGQISYVNTVDGNLVLTLTGMDSSKSYNLVFHAHRDDYGWLRASLVTISGADAFTNESSAATDNPTGTGGALFDGPSDASTRLPSDNDNGYVARFTNVDAGADGEIVLTISWDGVSGNEYKGKYASALMVQETEAGPPPQHTLTVNVVGDGSVTLDPPGGSYDEDTLVELTAVPGSGWEFSEWSDDLSGSANPEYITMSGDKTVTATFLEEGASLKFVVTGDTRGDDNGVNTTILGEMATATIAEDADFILIVGDLVNGSGDQTTLQSQLTTWRNTMQTLYTAGIGVYPVRGNHDTGSKTAWDNVFTGTYALPANGPTGEENITFSFTYGNVFVAGLDQYVADARVNQTWLDAQFASSTQPHVFVYGHEPAFAVYHSDCLDDYPSQRNAFWDSIVTEGGRTYFAGHDHIYNHARIDDGDGDPDNDLHQYVVGTGGAPLYTWGGSYGGDNGSWTPQLVHNESQYGYTLVEVDGSDVTITWKHRTAPHVYQPGGDALSYTVGLEPSSEWTAYNDLAAYSSSTPDGNFTFVTTDQGTNLGLPHSGELVDFDTGLLTGATLTVTGGSFNGASHVDTQTGPPSGDAAAVFAGIPGLDVGANFDATGTVSYGTTNIVLGFTGLEPTQVYTLVTFGHRDSYTDRTSVHTLSDVGTFTNNSSTGTVHNNNTGLDDPLFDAPNDSSTLLPSDNDSGWIVKYINMHPGADGDMTLTISDAGSAYNGATNSGRYVNAVMLQEFTPGPMHTLTVNVVGNGSVTLDPAGGTYDEDTVVELTAVPESGWEFSEWSGHLSGATNPEYITMSGDKTVTATFVEEGPPPPLPIQVGDDWRYFKGTEEPPSDWNEVGFDDSSWLVGATGIGYADGDDATVLGDMQGSYLSVYARKEFSVGDPGAVVRLLLSMDYDDGFVAYLNGTEVARANMTGTPGHDTPADGDHEASGGHPDYAEPVEYYEIDPGLLAAGTNVLAVQGHNKSLTSSDFSLIPALEEVDYTWIAYVDLRAEAGDNNHPHVLAIVPACVSGCTYPHPGVPGVFVDPTTDWVLKDLHTGTDLLATMSVDMDVRYSTTNGADSNLGTDADTIFGGIVDDVGGYEIDLVNAYVTVTFSNLDPDKEYLVAATYNRDDIRYENVRYTRVTIEGADELTNESSAGVVVNSADSVSFCTGYNGVNGHVARWTGVAATDGSFSITSEWDDTLGDDTSEHFTKGYAMTSYVLSEMPGVPPTEPPAAPSALSATAASEARIDLAWTDNAGNESDFEVERSTTGDTGPFSLLDTLSANTEAYADTGLDPGTEYCYRVRATNSVGKSAYTSVACATTLAEPPTCYELTLGHTGQGSDPVASPTHSTGCPAGEYVAAEDIELSGAIPGSGWQIESWTGTDDDGSTASTNALTMPASAHAAGVSYTQIPPTCYELTLGHTGQGSDPVASPTNSTGCPEGEYLGGEYIELSGATPDGGWQIGGWTGTGDDSSTADANWLMMPASAHSAAVNYTVTPPAAIEVVKTAEPTTIYAGETVEYLYRITNIGDAILTDVTLADDRLGDISLVPSRITDDSVALYTFGEGSGSVAHDVSGVGTPLDLTVADPDDVSWVPGGGLSVDSATIVESAGTASKIIDACQSSNEVTIEVWVKPDNAAQAGPARIVTLSDGTLLRNLTLGQSGAEYDTRLRTTATSDNGIPSLTAGTVSTDLTHVVYTRSTAGVGRQYVNGVEVGSLSGLTGSFSNWDASFHFGLANEFGAERSWLGEYHLVAIYSRALSSAEVSQNHEAGSGIVTLLPDESIEVAVVVTLDEDTTNTATVTGTPPVGDPVSDSDTASVDVEMPPGSITIVKESEPGGAEGFEFLGDLGSFSLDDDGTEVVGDLSVGDYEVTEVVRAGWFLMEVECTGGDYELTDGGVIIHLDARENITCTFTNEVAEYRYCLPLACRH